MPRGVRTVAGETRRRRWAAAVLGASLAVATAAGTAPADARTTGSPSTDEPQIERPEDGFDLAELIPLETPDIDPVLDGVDVVERPEIGRAQAEFERRVQAQGEATLRWVEAEQRRADMAARASTAGQAAADAQRTLAERVLVQADEQTRLEELQLAEDVLRAQLADEQTVLRGLAAEVISSDDDDQYALLGTLLDWTEADRRGATRDRAIELQSAEVERARRPWAKARDRRRAQAAELRRARVATAEAADEAARTAEERDRFDELLAAITGQSQDARAKMDRATDETREAIVVRRAARLESRVADAGMPLVALHAYWRASSLAPCTIPWWVLAGVGKVETRHASAQGAELTATGDTTVPIRGIPLDGRPGTAAIGDTDGGLLDGDGRWDRAVGPMQFIPGTWGRWAADGNADDKADPHNIYDAALAAARYLCYTRGPLTDDGAIRGALLAYNRSVPYGTKVIAEGRRYLDALELPELADLPDGARPPQDRTPGR